MTSPSSWPAGQAPSEAAVQAVHERYQVEVVEGLGLCPFARRSRELGRVHRPTYIAVDDQDCVEPRKVAEDLAALIRAHADTEIVLLTFPVPPAHPWRDPARFEAFLKALRPIWDALAPSEFFMVAFHPELRPPADRPLNRDSLVSLLRRSPDPVIQCVNATILEDVRAQAQASARERMLRELEAKDPALAALFARSIQPDPELSSDIAKQNFRNLGDAEGLARLDAAVASVLDERNRRYGLE